MKEILYIIFGWLLGLLGQPVILRIERHFKRKDVKIAIFSELKNLAVRLAATCYKIQSNLGITDRTKLTWVKNVHEKYRIDGKDMVESLDKVLEMTDEQINAMASSRKAPEGICISLKKHSLPFIESISEQISVFEPKFQKEIFEIQAQVNILNEEIENAMYSYRLTFDPSSMKTNKDIINQNITKCYHAIEERCVIVVSEIEKLFKL